MYAIIKTGGKQYRVSVGDEIDVELLPEDVGSQVKFTEVLFINKEAKPVFGQPSITGSFVAGEVVDHAAGPKITSMKYIPGNHRKRIGHRQHYSRVKITEIAG